MNEERLRFIANNSNCKRRKVGCFITNKAGEIISFGYNYAMCGKHDCCRRENIESGKDIANCNAIHAEIMAIIDAKQDLSDCILYINTSPCYNCAKAIVESGIKEVHYLQLYDDNLDTRTLFERNNVKFIKDV